MSTTQEKRMRLDKYYGPQYERALRIANEHGFTTVSMCRKAIRSSEEVASEFTTRELATINNAANRQVKGWKEMGVKVAEHEDVLTETNALVTVMNSQGTTTKIPQSSIIPSTSGTSNLYRFPAKRAFDHNKAAILDEIGAYVTARQMGLAVGAYHYVDTNVDTSGASGAATDLWRAATAMDIAMNQLADAYGLTKDGTPFVAMDADGQRRIAEQIAYVRQIADGVRATCWAIDGVTNEMHEQQKEVASGTATQDTDDAVAAG